MLASLPGRRGWRTAVRRQWGSDATKAVAEYQTAVTELACLTDRMARRAAGPDAAQWRQDLVQAVRLARAG
ncbi:hypothetical protein [Actinopolymorpha pittospori]